jgi:hypothetical protein
MEQIPSLISALNHVVDSSDSMYRDHAGAPTEDSMAWREVVEHDGRLAVVTGLPSPLFGAYADAEYKLGLLNDLIRSFTSLVAKSDVSLGEMVVARSVIEVAARMHWGLASGDNYRERASRWLREWLRIISEAKKLGSGPHEYVEELGNETLIKEGAVRAGLNVPGPPPGAIDLVWMVMSATPGPLRFHGLKREDVVAVFYRKLSAVTHGSSLGVQSHVEELGTGTSIRSTKSSSSDVLTLTAGVLTAYSNAHGALAELYGWDSSSMKIATDNAVAEVRSAYSLFSTPLDE